MKDIKKMRPRAVVLAIAASFVVSQPCVADSTPDLTGKDLGQNRELLGAVMHGRNYVVELDKLGKIKQVVDAGAIGSGKDAQSVINAKVAGAPASSAAVSSVELPLNYQGEDAVDYIGVDLPVVAEKYGLAPEKLKEMFLADNTIHIDSNKHIFYVDDSAGQGLPDGIATIGAVAEGETASGPELPISVAPTTANAFSRHSKPGASKTIYLDFDGYTATKTAWSSSTIVAPAFDLDGKPTTFNANELANIIKIWGRVAEDYIPFDVDVTTEEPTKDALVRANTADDTYGTRVVITKSGTVSCSCGGVAYVDVVSMLNNTAYQPAWVFQQSLANNEKYIAEAISHEAGHTLGLYHDGKKTTTSSTSYYEGHGTGNTGWASIMGVGYYKNVTQWSRGEYPGANNKQDDLAVLASNGFVQRLDDVGNTFASAISLTSSGTGATVKAFGVIESSGDVDMYRVETTGGLVNFTVKPVAIGANLDTKLTLFKDNGGIVATNAPELDLSASISATVPAGTYFLAVSGSGHAAAGSDYGYPAYASLGQYQIAGGYASSGIAALPTAVLSASTLTGPASLAVNFSGKSSLGNGNIIGYQWAFGDGTYSTSPTPSHNYTKAGAFTATLRVTNQYLLTDTKSVKITVTPKATAQIHAASMRIAVVKSSKVGAQIAITVVDDQKRPIPNTVVSGTWSGSFTGTVSGTTGANGIMVQTANAIAKKTGGAATYTLKKIEGLGYVYNPRQNAKSVVTVAW